MKSSAPADEPVKAGTGAEIRACLDEAAQTPWRFSYMALMRYFSARHPDLPEAGKAQLPAQELFRLSQLPSLTFAPREIADIDLRHDGLPRIRLFSLGMLGPNGPLPIHFTEIAKDRLENRKDRTLVDFLDIFHHRFLTLFYRAWAQSQAAAGLDRAKEERFSRYVAWLNGDEFRETEALFLPSHARIAASAHLIREARNPDGITATLANFLGVPVALREFVHHWIEIAQDERNRLGKPSIASVLGEGAILGGMVPDRQHYFCLVIGPLNLEEYLRFLPNGRDLPVLIEWVRAFVGFEYHWSIQLEIRTESAPTTQLGATQRLGWTSWLGRNRQEKVVTGMLCEPEYYVSRRRDGSSRTILQTEDE
ncbi:MAG: type VI secretion system baseplate subunit TssG [Zoogloeaceae bacterium]|nr:type VI secretion system baseplate subunit TssG [Zoogloeaceae bacterium]